MNSPSPDREGPRSTPTAMLSTAGEVRADRVIAGVQRRQPVQVDLERHLTGGKGFQQIDQRPAREQPARRLGQFHRIRLPEREPVQAVLLTRPPRRDDDEGSVHIIALLDRFPAQRWRRATLLTEPCCPFRGQSHPPLPGLLPPSGPRRRLSDEPIDLRLVRGDRLVREIELRRLGAGWRWRAGGVADTRGLGADWMVATTVERAGR